MFISEKDVFARNADSERLASITDIGMLPFIWLGKSFLFFFKCSVALLAFFQLYALTFLCSSFYQHFQPFVEVTNLQMYFDWFTRYQSCSCHLGCSCPHPARRPDVLLYERKEEVFATPARACQHCPSRLWGQRASGLQHHHQAHLTPPQSSFLTPCPTGEWHSDVSYGWTNSN